MSTLRKGLLSGLLLGLWIISSLSGAGCRAPAARQTGIANKPPVESVRGVSRKHPGSKTNQTAMVSATAQQASSPSVARPNIATAFAAYRIQPNDTLMINLRGITPEQPAIELVVDENGDIRLPYISPINAAGKSPSELEDAIRTSYLTQKIYKHLTVNVIVPSQTAPTFYVKGEVRSPGRLPYVNGMTVLAAIVAAGGPTDFASSDLWLLRGSKRIKFNYHDLEKHPEKDQLIQAGDIISVERGWF